MQILEKAVEEGNHGDGLELINLVASDLEALLAE